MLKIMKKLTFKIGGIHPPQSKHTSSAEIIRPELPREVTILLKQHAGAEAVPIVAKGDHVARGQKIAEASGFVSAPVHASISGTVKSVGPALTLEGRYAQAIVISASDDDHAADMQSIGVGEARDIEHITPEDIVGQVANCGVVGLGGATFPTAVKLSSAGEKAKLLVIDACECEPKLTCDDAVMRLHADDVVQGIKLMLKALRIDHAVIGIEDNKPQAIEALSAACASEPGIEVATLKARYPQGGEKMLVYALTGKEIPSGGLPISVGCVVNNVGTARAVYRAVALGEPLIERIVTIEGLGNFLLPIGIRLTEVIKAYDKDGLYDLDAASGEIDVINGGPMMGRSIVNLNGPVTKGVSGIVSVKPFVDNVKPCIRCGSCQQACPMGLQPFLLEAYGHHGLIDEAKQAGALDCLECGSCSYSCPSARPILDYIRLCKLKIRSK